jgi:nucleoside-diphosphate-sugar epimerase
MTGMRARKILITGATGWLGKRLVRLLAKQEIKLAVLPFVPRCADIRVLTPPGEDAAPLKTLGVEVSHGDLRSTADCARFCEGARDAVLLHIAGIIHPRRITEFYEINRDGTKHLLNAAIQAQIRRAVIVSSNSPLGMNSDTERPFDESSPFHPYMNYGRSKMQMEMFVSQIARAGRIETVVLRPPWFYGPDQPPRQTLFFSMIRSGKVPIIGTGNNLRSMGYIDNLCEGLLLAAFVECANGQTYWIADRRPYSMNEIVDTIERLLEQEFKLPVAHKRLRLPGFISKAAMMADGMIQGLGFYNQKIHVLSEMNQTIACSIAKAEKELGYDPRISLEEGMRRSIADCIGRGIAI